MSITIHLSDDAAETFGRMWGNNLDRATLEALVVQGYQHRKLGISAVRRLLGFDSRWQAEEWLGRQGVNWNYSVDDLEADRQTIDQVLGPAKR